MNISYNWLKRYLDADITAERMAEILTELGLEVEEFEKIETIKGGLKGVVVGEVLTCEDHPDSDHRSGGSCCWQPRYRQYAWLH